VRAYFNSTGFERWRRIYDPATDDVNRVQLDIREGHAQTVAATLAMLRDAPDVPLAGATVCDAGCGTGSLSIPLAAAGASVLASDISAAMVSEAQKMIRHLASLAGKRLVISFAPKTLYFDVLKRVGELFPGPSKATRAYLHSEKDIEEALRAAGWRVNNKGFISTQFYFAKLYEAVPVAAGSS
uniref:Magnesium-protoporphyrin IX methyltransferase C-terminal domain-containing protein n=1 Tax=Aegilops tauschii subsp. strangulata TaxID=200361 RepID=A0A453QJJ3_AEGTS